ncbi:MAG: hypothetical protein HRU19_24780 [Pseudobacteriovorax sp.]|nr:hypothetical protein [Pseudobacteriovorax sp.]
MGWMFLDLHALDMIARTMKTLRLDGVFLGGGVFGFGFISFHRASYHIQRVEIIDSPFIRCFHIEF